MHHPAFLHDHIGDEKPALVHAATRLGCQHKTFKKWKLGLISETWMRSLLLYWVRAVTIFLSFVLSKSWISEWPNVWLLTIRTTFTKDFQIQWKNISANSDETSLESDVTEFPVDTINRERGGSGGKWGHATREQWYMQNISPLVRPSIHPAARHTPDNCMNFFRQNYGDSILHWTLNRGALEHSQWGPSANTHITVSEYQERHRQGNQNRVNEKRMHQEELSSKQQLEHWWMNLSGHYSATSWISNPLNWFIDGAVT